MAALSRRFQNLIVSSPYIGARWLGPVDLMTQLFCDDTAATATIGDRSEPAAAAAADAGNQKKRLQHDMEEATAALKMEKMRIPSTPIFRFQATDSPDLCCLEIFPLWDRNVVIADHTGRAFHCDADTRRVVAMPNLHKDKLFDPISLFVPGADRRGSLYVMDRVPRPEKGGGAQLSDQFQALVCTSEPPCWHSRLLPAPPFVYDPAVWWTYCGIKSYAVVGTDMICISTECNGTYCLDTATNAWSQVGKGKLPFYGKAEYAPELKLWFGLSAQVGNLVAVDLSGMDSSRPPLVGEWENEFDPPEEWLAHDDSQLVNLGSGRFCIVRFFKTQIGTYKGCYGHEPIYHYFVVFTGVEVMPVAHGVGSSDSRRYDGSERAQLRMIKHKSRRTSGSRSCSIRAVL